MPIIIILLIIIVILLGGGPILLTMFGGAVALPVVFAKWIAIGAGLALAVAVVKTLYNNSREQAHKEFSAVRKKRLAEIQASERVDPGTREKAAGQTQSQPGWWKKNK